MLLDQLRDNTSRKVLIAGKNLRVSSVYIINKQTVCDLLATIVNTLPQLTTIYSVDILNI